MATLMIRNLDDNTKQALRFRAASHGVSMEQEARVILKKALNGAATAEHGAGENWYQSIRKLVKQHGGFDLEIPPRSKSMREPPSFE